MAWDTFHWKLLTTGKRSSLVFYPSEKLSAATPIAVTSMYVFPSAAVNHIEPSENDSPVFASYDITDKVTNKDAALEEMLALNKSIAAGEC